MLSATIASAVFVDLPMINSCVYADKERNVHSCLTESWQSGKLRVFTLYITAFANTNTAFHVAFGEDSVITNSYLDSSELAVSFGFNGGVWEIRPEGLRERYTAVPASTNSGEKTLLSGCASE